MELCLLMTGKREMNSWHQAEQGDMDFFDLKGVIENLFTSLHIQEVEWKKHVNSPTTPGVPQKFWSMVFPSGSWVNCIQMSGVCMNFRTGP